MGCGVEREFHVETVSFEFNGRFGSANELKRKAQQGEREKAKCAKSHRWALIALSGLGLTQRFDQRGQMREIFRIHIVELDADAFGVDMNNRRFALERFAVGEVQPNAMAFAGFTTDNSPALSKIDKPTVIAAASKDLMPTFQDMQKRIPGSKIETFDDAGHALFVDDAEKFNILLEEFITTLK